MLHDATTEPKGHYAEVSRSWVQTLVCALYWEGAQPAPTCSQGLQGPGGVPGGLPENAFSGPRGKLGTRAWETLGVKDVSPSTSWAQYLKGGYCHVPSHGMASVTVELHIYGSDAYADNLSIVAFWPSGSIM